MTSSTISVIVPVYNGADHLTKAIQSVLDQTYPYFELVIINDASTDNSAEIVHQINDPRIVYIEHELNRGANAARNTGVQRSSGDIVAFLDQDDMYHPDKLQMHIDLLTRRPDVGFSYNSRFELNHSSTTIREIWRPPENITLADLVLGFPLSPSEMVLRRKWFQKVDAWDEMHDFHGGEIILTGRLYMAGCLFAGIDRALNYRRYHSARRLNDMYGKCRSELNAQEKILSDPRCPDKVLALRDKAHANTYMIWAYIALVQEETAIGQELIREAIRLQPGILEGEPCELTDFFLVNSMADESKRHEKVLHDIVGQLPEEISWLSRQLDWSVAQGYLLRAARGIVWARSKKAEILFDRAKVLNAEIGEPFVQKLTYQLMSYELEYGVEATDDVIVSLAPHLEKVGGQRAVRRLKACYSINRAFQDYAVGYRSRVPRVALRAIANDPSYLFNRGVMSILVRSLLNDR